MAARLFPVNETATVLDQGPILHADIELCGDPDPDLEHALMDEGLDPEAATYWLIEIPSA